MSKINWKPGSIIYPIPAVMVSCGHDPAEYNIITIAWTGTINSNPPLCYISVRPSRYSYDIIKRTGEFVINLTTEELAKATDWCGCRSGRKYNKWKKMNLTPVQGQVIKAPIIKESPVNIECRVINILELGSHHAFVAEVVNISVDDKYLDDNKAFIFSKAKPIVYNHGHYFGLGKIIGKFGWSVQKKKKINI